MKVLYSPIHFTDAGIVMEVKLVQYAKHKEPIDVTDAGMVIKVKLLYSTMLQMAEWLLKLSFCNPKNNSNPKKLLMRE